MNQRSPMQPYLGGNSIAIRKEIQRFESVHPSIYAIYDLVDAIPDKCIQQQIREHVVCIEDSFVNSQEWTLSRSVPDLKLGILGDIHSGKSALVHRYLTGAYMQEESPEGGRFKKEVCIEGQSYLLLIRDEGGPPENQFIQWVDAVIFVFSLENEMSFKTVYNHYNIMKQYRNPTEIPVILVGTQDAICENNPRVIDDMQARKLSSDLKRCSYYETCATYGLNVDRVFVEACQKIMMYKFSPHLSTNTMSNVQAVPAAPPPQRGQHYMGHINYECHSMSSQSTSSSGTLGSMANHMSQGHIMPVAYRETPMKERDNKPEKAERKQKESSYHQQHTQAHSVSPYHYSFPEPADISLPDSNSSAHTAIVTPVMFRKNKRSSTVHKSNSFSENNHLTLSEQKVASLNERLSQDPSHISPVFSRFSRVRSSFMLGKKDEEKPRVRSDELGSGRVIPLKQGHLFKKSHGINKEWKKKYVTLLDDGRLTYHPSLNDYMSDVHGKEISLTHTTVKIPGQRPRVSRANTTSNSNSSNTTQTSIDTNHVLGKSTKERENVMLTAYEDVRDGYDEKNVILNSSNIPNGDLPLDKKNMNSFGNLKIETPNVKKRHRRAKSGGGKNQDSNQIDEAEDYEFIIVSLENKHWHFEAQNSEDRDHWVQMIQEQILVCLQGNETNKSKTQGVVSSSLYNVQAIRDTRGNSVCADCEVSKPDWASINLGAVICIECSGIHRNLGTHLSRVRSLTLDDWPPDIIMVMISVGNTLANSVWEACTKGHPKPSSSSSRDEKERWIRAKYEQKEFLPPTPYAEIPKNQQLIDALVREDMKNIILLLAHCQPADINAPYNNEDGRTSLHIAAALGNVVYVQFLLWYSADVKKCDHEGKNALWYARRSGVSECAELLIINGCPEHATMPRRRVNSQHQTKDGTDKLPASMI